MVAEERDWSIARAKARYEKWLNTDSRQAGNPVRGRGRRKPGGKTSPREFLLAAALVFVPLLLFFGFLYTKVSQA
jgi:hypothetical protein